MPRKFGINLKRKGEKISEEREKEGNREKNTAKRNKKVLPFVTRHILCYLFSKSISDIHVEVKTRRRLSA